MSHYKKIYSIKLCIPHYFSNRNLLFVFFLIPNIHLIYVLVKSTVELEPSLSTAGDIPVNKNIEQLPSNVSPSAAAIKPPVPARNPSSSAPIAPSRVAPAIPPRPSSSNIPTDLTTAKTRRNEYKQNALQAKRSGDQAKAIQYVRLVKVTRI